MNQPKNEFRRRQRIDRVRVRVIGRVRCAELEPPVVARQHVLRWVVGPLKIDQTDAAVGEIQEDRLATVSTPRVELSESEMRRDDLSPGAIPLV